MSGKFAVLANMLDLLRRCTRDRIVIVSNYTQTLDLVGQVRRREGRGGNMIALHGEEEGREGGGA
jgi:hypothetical protein